MWEIEGKAVEKVSEEWREILGRRERQKEREKTGGMERKREYT